MADLSLNAASSLPRKHKRLASPDESWMKIGLIALCAVWIVFTAFPITALFYKSLFSKTGEFVGLANFATYFNTPSLVISAWNSLWISTLITVITIPLAFFYSFALTRSCMPFINAFRALALIPLLAPSLLPAIALVYLFGNQGVAKWALFGNTIYGPIGIVIAQVFFNFPAAVMIFLVSLKTADSRLYEAADSLGATKFRRFLTVTLPGSRFAIFSAFFIVFTKAITDFGSVIVIGGQFSVMATEMYKQVVGQLNFSMGAVVGVILMIPAVLAFAGSKWVASKQKSSVTAQAKILEVSPNKARDYTLLLFCSLVGGFMLLVLGMAVWGSTLTYWPYNLTFSAKNYDFSAFDADGWKPFFNSIYMAMYATVIGTPIIVVGAWLISRTPGLSAVKWLLDLVITLPLAVPGLVLGLGYLFMFNNPDNPLYVLTGTLLLLAINTVVHYATICHLTAMTALQQIDENFDAVSASLKRTRFTTFFKVYLPIMLPAILEIAAYIFLSAMVTVSSLVFLYGPKSRVASISVINMEDAGFTSGAAAMATCIVVTSLFFKIIHAIAGRAVNKRTQKWRKQ